MAGASAVYSLFARASFLLIALSILSTAEECPFPCVCFPNLGEDRSTLTVDCRGQELQQLPYPIPNSTSHLDVSGNEIEYIRVVDLPSLPRLTYLQLQNNNIRVIQVGAFQGTTNLQRITMYNNRITELSSGVFRGLSRLQHLDAYNIQLQRYDIDVFNSLENIVEIDLSFNNLETIARGSFSGLRRLQRLSLSFNFITNIEQMAITNLSSLAYLNIDNNKLTAITPQAFTRLPFIRTVALQGNPLECGCDAVWLYNWLTRKRVVGPRCAQPQNLVGQNLLSLQLMEFCARPVANISGPGDIIITAGMTLQLQCQATGAPPPNITWSRDGMTFDPSSERVVMTGRSLEIMNVNEDDSGTYFCIAVSTAGRVAVSARVTVLNVTAENFTTILARLRQNMLLECSDTLPPGIPVSWEFNSSPLPPSDKHVITTNGSLLVRNVQLEDMGEYQCVVDGVRLTRELVIEALPEITEFPEGPCDMPTEFTINSNVTTILRCTAFGIPPPSVTFFNEDRTMLATMSPPPDMNGGSTTAELILVNPAVEQGAPFTCVAENELGNVSRTVNIRVRLILRPGAAPIISLDRFAGDTVVLECASGDIMERVEMVRWVRMDGLDLPLDRINFTSFNTTLILKDLRAPADIAVYTCISTVGGVQRILSYGVTVVAPPSIERQRDTPVVIGLVGDDITLTCNATGNPPVNITWTKNGIPIFPVPGRIELIGNRERLVILRAEDEDSGNYTCLAVNRVASDSYTIILDVQRRPYFTHQPVDTQVSATEIAQLQCAGAGNPQPTVTWWRVFNESVVQQVMPTPWVIISDDYLVFLETRVSDEGNYYCNISSPHQTRTTANNPTFLRVYTPPSLIRPPPPNEYIVLEGATNVTLACGGTGDPVPEVHWLKNGDILPVAGQVQLPGGSLVIEQVEAEDAGRYRCRVANVAGMLYHDVNLIVRTIPDTRVEPRNVRANIGCQVTLFCSDGGRTPSEEVTWMFNGRDLEAGGRVVIRSSGELIISDLEVADSGNYTCAIWGLAGAGESTAVLVVEDPLFGSGVDRAPPTISSPTPSSQLIPEGQTAQFVCVAFGFPQPTIQWLRDGQPQPNFRRVTINGSSLTIEQLRFTDAATYECVAFSVLGERRRAFSLTVSQPPSFLTRPTPLTLTELQPLLLGCTAEGNPEPEIMWMFNDQLLVIGGRVIAANGTLLIFNSSVADSGMYTCVARNSAGTVQYTVPVLIQPSQVPPNITVPPRSNTTTAGNSIALDCIASGVPPPQITWLKDGQRLVTTCVRVDQVECVRVDGPSVFIQSAEERDTGRYTCIAENSAGRVVYEVFITVETARIAPFFTIYPTPVWVTNGSTISVNCQASGSPPPNITWLIGFEPVNGSERVMVLENGTLVIENADFDDSGLYTCRANNTAGTNQIVISIDVVPEEELSRPPVIVRAPFARIDLAPDQTIVLDCVADGSPAPHTRWLREGRELNYTDYDNIYQVSNGSLVLANVTELDEGNYTCQAVNNGGTAEAHIRIDVLEGLAAGQGAPHFTVQPHSQPVLSGSSLQVDCQAEGSPPLYIMWTQSDRPVYESDVVSVTGNGSLMISSAKMAHNGRYKCRASNNRGLAEMGVELKIMPREEPPYFTTTPVDTRVVTGSHFILSCEAVSYEGHTHTRWLMGTQEVGVVRAGVGRTRREVLGDGSLLVTRAELSDSGEYTCSASNKYGVMNATAFVTVLRRPLNATRSVLVGSSTQLDCGEGERKEWSKNGQPLLVSPRLLVYGSSLWLFRVLEEDEGEYTCTKGTNLTNFYLEVLVPPRIVGSSTLVTVPKGGTAVLHCTAEGRPRPQVSWLRGGQQLGRYDQYSPLHNGTLLVYMSSPETHAGEYTCRAENSAGAVQSSVLLVVGVN